MVKAGRAICTLYSKMVWRMQFIELRKKKDPIFKMSVNLCCVKKIFLKSPYRTQMFKTLASGIPLPPEPVITRLPRDHAITREPGCKLQL